MLSPLYCPERPFWRTLHLRQFYGTADPVPHSFSFRSLMVFIHIEPLRGSGYNLCFLPVSPGAIYIQPLRGCYHTSFAALYEHTIKQVNLIPG